MLSDFQKVVLPVRKRNVGESRKVWLKEEGRKDRKKASEVHDSESSSSGWRVSVKEGVRVSFGIRLLSMAGFYPSR